MRRRLTLSGGLLLAIVGILCLLTVTSPAAAQTLGPLQPESPRWRERVFAFNGSDGALPTASVTMDSNGTLYGTTGAGGSANAGVAFTLTPTRAGWTETVLHSFTGPDGNSPDSALLAGPHGTLFGVASSGGAYCQGSFCLGGTVFALTPPPAGQRHWTITVLHSFSSSDPAGSGPAGNLLADRHGNLYGAASGGGRDGSGTIFELKTPATSKQTWTLKVLHVFNERDGDGAVPTGGLIADSGGTLYGTTEDGGSGTACPGGCGTVFALVPPQHGTGAWTEHILYSFTNTNGDGSLPDAGVVAGTDGSLYGTTYFGGAANNGGIVYRLSPSSRTSGWSETIVHEFSTANGDGYNPYDALIAGPGGALYGTTSVGGFGPSSLGGGVVFRLTPPQAGSGAWDETILHRFNPRINGDSWASVLRSPDGALYGTTVVGGGNAACTQGCGTIFALFPPA